MITFLKKLFGGTTANFKELVNKGAVIVDVRSTGEYSAGHIPGSINYPLETIRSKVTGLKKLTSLLSPCAAVEQEVARQWVY